MSIHRSDVEPQTTLTADDWTRRWETWHSSQAHNALKRFISRFIKPSHTNPSPRILVPLCGATVDLVYLANAGYTVIGIEYLSSAVDLFFQENAAAAVSYQITQVAPSITRYSASALPIHIFRADIYDAALTADIIGGHCDHVWDRAALVAVNRSERTKYIRKIVSLTSVTAAPSAAALLLNVFAYPQAMMHGPPFAVTDDDITRIFTHVANGTNDERDTINVDVTQAAAARFASDNVPFTQLTELVAVKEEKRKITGDIYSFDIEWLDDTKNALKHDELFIERNYSITVRTGNNHQNK